MSQTDRKCPLENGQTQWAGPSEPESHTEHQAALAATLFRAPSDPSELVLELESGELRLRNVSDR